MAQQEQRDRQRPGQSESGKTGQDACCQGAAGQDPGRPECNSGVGRKDVTGTTNVYPASGPWPQGDARLQPMGTWGQAGRGPEGAQDSGHSEIIPPGRRAEDEQVQKEQGKK
jgi:hypothetical protein